MVRILANGELVPDDDPRARQAGNRMQTGIDNVRNLSQEQNHGQGQPVSIFTSVNQRLVAYGIPRWNIGQTVIEPIVSVGFLLSFMLFGCRGIMVGGVLFLVNKWSQDGPPEFIGNLLGNNRPSNRRDRGANRGGVGHRLGRS